MVHAIRLDWKLGCGALSDRVAARCHALVEAGYLLGSVLFTLGTVFFFPLEGLEDYVTGCRLYELGSLLFAGLTLYAEIDRWHARRAGRAEVTKRELLEVFFYCVGSIIFLIGTFMYDPPIVTALTNVLGVPKAELENTAGGMFMFGSFLFAAGAYVNAMGIFEAPRIFRKHLVIVTSSYMFGGVLFVAGTMGYIEAFEPNEKLRTCATSFYLIGCLFYCLGTFLSFVHTVARHQVRWERIQDMERRKKQRMRRLLGRAGRLAKKATGWKRKRRPKPSGPDDDAMTEATEDTVNSDEFDLEAIDEPEDEDDGDLNLDVAEAKASKKLASVLGPDIGKELVAAIRDGDEVLDGEGVVERRVSQQLTTVLGPEAGRELVAALRDGDEVEDGIFGAFWRGVTGAGPGGSSLMGGDSPKKAGEEDSASAVASNGGPPNNTIGHADKDNLSLMQTRH